MKQQEQGIRGISDFKKYNIQGLGKELLERVFQLKLTADVFSSQQKADLIQINEKTKTVEVIVEITRSKLTQKNVRDIEEKMFQLYKELTPQRIIILVFEFIDPDAKKVLENSMSVFSRRMFNIELYDGPWIVDVLAQNPDLAEKWLIIYPDDAYNMLSLPQINNDNPNYPEDLLGFNKDIRSFASLLALKELKPPVSIALFGNWGSGKSFFMNKLKETIDYITENRGFNKIDLNASKSEVNEKNVFCEGIAQINFNAWSYMDSNLMASMVAEIFEKLDEYISDKSKGEKEIEAIKEELTEKLGLAKEQKFLIEEKINKIAQSKKEIKDNIENKRKRIEDIRLEISKKTRSEIISKLLSENNFQDKLKELLGTEKYTLIKDAEDLNPDNILKHVKSFHFFFQNVLRNSGKEFFWFLVTIIIFLAILLFPVITPDFFIGKAFKIPQIVLSVLSFLPFILLKVKRVLTLLSPVISSITKVKEEYETKLNNAISEYEQYEKTAQIEVQQIENEIFSFNTKLIDLEKSIRELEYNLKNTISQRALYSFISARSHSDDYSRHLGVISTIRKDFETLSQLFDKANDEHKRFRDNFEKPLERIVLYVDDLDRCSDDKVLEVLQAVHLLLAFPLFVVVVGVDKRCVHNALTYRNLLQYSHLTESKKPEDLKSFGIEVIQPSEYLEKIFQIPFHIPDASDENIKNLVARLSYIPKEEDTEGMGQLEDYKISELQKKELESFPPLPYGDIPFQTEESIIEENNKERPQVRFKPINLKLSAEEIQNLQMITWLVGNSPRTIKRFLNIYRIIRSHESLQYAENEKESSFLAIAFTLALFMGPYKKKSGEFFNEDSKYQDFEQFLKEVHLLPVIIEKKSTKLLSLQTKYFRNVISIVKRFSFE